MQSEKEIVLRLPSGEASGTMLEKAKKAGIRRILTPDEPPASVSAKDFSIITVSDEPGHANASWVKVAGAEDVQRALAAGARNQAFVVVECSDWKIIPLENLIAEFRRRGSRLYSFASSKEEIQTAFAILEKGVDGVVIPPSSIDAVVTLSPSSASKLPMLSAKVSRVLDAGPGERACVDTTSKLELGEGMLVGSRAGFYFLVHGETIASQYIPARPFRVNAGALHSYLLSPDGKTKYLSEIEPPDRVALVNTEGRSRTATVGRVKIERRPLVLIEAIAGDSSGTVILQRAETIRLVRTNGAPVSVTVLKPGDEVLVHTERARARHFGGEVDEHIEEK